MSDSQPTEPPEPSTSPPGWYPDPWAQANQRYWDGTQWTGHITAPTSPAGPRAKASTARTVGIVVLAILAGVIGYLLLGLASYWFA